MPVVVTVLTPDDFQKWVAEQKAALKQPAAAGQESPAAPAQPPRTAQVALQ
jgi:heme/copper-type cytochrome/quinol oxidase subunit 2